MARDRGLMVAAVPLSFPGRGPRVLAPIGRQAAPDVRRLVRSVSTSSRGISGLLCGKESRYGHDGSLRLLCSGASSHAARQAFAAVCRCARRRAAAAASTARSPSSYCIPEDCSSLPPIAALWPRRACVRRTSGRNSEQSRPEAALIGPGRISGSASGRRAEPLGGENQHMHRAFGSAGFQQLG